jgi:uncharacterized repeat protein (TIGR01451 family)
MGTSLIQSLGCHAAVLFLSLGMHAAPVLAQAAGGANSNKEIEAVLTSKKVTIGADKKEVLIEAKNVKPGEIIEYQATYTNKSKAAISKLTPNLPIPEGTEYLAGTAKPALIKATLGDGKFEAIPLKIKVKLPDGKEVEQEVPAARYKALQWSLGELPAGKSLTVSARVRVSDAPNVAAPPTAPSSAGGAK